MMGNQFDIPCFFSFASYIFHLTCLGSYLSLKIAEREHIGNYLANAMANDVR